MATRTPILPLALPPREPGTPAYRWLCAALRTEILEGRLRPGTRLPATRDLASQYGLSRGTVVSAFDQLRSEGYVEGSVGSGTYVNRVLPDELLQVQRRSGARPPARRNPPRRVSDFATRVRPLPPPPDRPARAFRIGQPALDLFPTTLWSQIAARRMRAATTDMLLGCGIPMGYRPLREAVADYLSTSRGVNCAPEQVAIVAGVQEALDVVAQVLLGPGDRACMEDPGYTGADLVFRAAGAEVHPVPLDEEGMRVPAHLQDVRLAYVTPAHQFPVGISMSLARRLALLEWARRSGALIFEDDYDSEYRYAGRPLPALQGLDRHGVVLFAGSFSKVLFPSIRLGYLVIPPDLVDYFDATKSVTSRHAPLLEQAVLCDFITGGHFGRHVRRMREVYAERLSVLLECAQERLAGLLEISGIEAGLQTAGWLGAGIDGEAATAAAAERDVQVTPLSRYSRHPMAREGLHLGFAAVDAHEIRHGVRELAGALEGLRRP